LFANKFSIFHGEQVSVKPCDENIKKTLELAQDMIKIADMGDEHREDVGCGVLFGIVRDSAFKIIKLAEEEKQKHMEKGWWKEDQG
jgi:hypothetical protein